MYLIIPLLLQRLEKTGFNEINNPPVLSELLSGID